ncbi:DUF3592 domain-containing protein [Streptomyces actinomycinicus]|uniref:DUF3592 domain-containing protein n=1 Tax=Streptomyces actinomycinicus TaxID=1695166 RepID=A0A937ER94_9ACTN|nr:DUF3592 domain-containing protein [Streptomyces actinomycinicus]MBL1086985.1 DUF3592 domain-containing protein [Streptomyces actinomycinicus]
MQGQVRGRNARRWIIFGTIAFGALFLVIGLILAGVSVSFLTDAERAKGTVVSLEWREDHDTTSRDKHTDDRPVAYPVVEFTPENGTPTRFQDSTGSNPPAYEEGERVEVLYRADSPEDARINGFASLWLLPLIFGGLGLLVSGIGTVVAVVTRRRARSRGVREAVAFVKPRRS